MERNQRQALGCVYGADRPDGGVDLPHAGHEHEDVSRLTGIDDVLYNIGRLVGSRPFVRNAEVSYLDRKTLAFGNKNGAGDSSGGGLIGSSGSRVRFKILRDGFCFERGGHYGQLEIWPLILLQMFDQRQRDVAEQVALMEFVKQDHSNLRQHSV